jgi:DNA-binding MarR family transcriptional regulator
MRLPRTTSMTVPFVLALIVTLLLVSTVVATEEESTITGRIFDETSFDFIAGANVTITFLGNGTELGSTVSDDEGKYNISGLATGWYVLSVRAEGYENLTKQFQIKYTPSGPPPDLMIDAHLAPSQPFKPPGPGPAPTYMRYGVMAVIVAVTSLVMYSKIKKENLLRHAVRARILNYVKENPGQHYRAILNDLDLTMGVLTYHLNRLEKAEYLRSRQDGMYRRFFVTGRKTEVRFFLSDIQESILATIRENQGISQSRIADQINVSRKVVNYHVNILDQAGLIYMESRGREMACFASGTMMSGTP